jgi:hypothetical protein
VPDDLAGRLRSHAANQSRAQVFLEPRPTPACARSPGPP